MSDVGRRKPVSHPMVENQAQQILIIKKAALGDVLRTTCALRPLKQKYPGARITWLTVDNALALLEHNPCIDRLLTTSQTDMQALVREQFHWIINLEEDQASCRLARDARAEKKIGGILDEFGTPTYTPDAEPWFGMGLLRSEEKGGLEEANRLKLVNTRTYPDILLGILGLSAKNHEFILKLGEENKAFANGFMAKAGVGPRERVIGLNTSAGGRWPMKSLSLEKTVELANQLMKKKRSRVVLFGGGEEIRRNREIIARCPGIIDAGTDNSLLDFAALIGCCHVLVTTDSLALHMGTARKIQIVAFFGPTSAAEIELYGRGEKLIAQSEYYCTYRKDDPLGIGIVGLDVKTILAAVERVLKNSDPEPIQAKVPAKAGT